MRNNHEDYDKDKAPGVLMPNEPNHDATRSTFNKFSQDLRDRPEVTKDGRTHTSAPDGKERGFCQELEKTSAKKGKAAKIDWSKVPPGSAWRLAEEQFEAADTPPEVREEYFRQFNEYRDGLKQK